MPDLEKQIAKWRQRMLAAGIKPPVLLEELESHLRDEVERQIKSGENAQQAFESAVKKMGQPAVLETEFRKIRSDKWAREEKWMRLYCIAFPVLYSWVGVYGLFRIEMSPVVRVLGFTALALTGLFIWSTQHYYRLLPAISDKRRRTRIQIGSTLVWMICGGALMNLILPNLNLTEGQITVTVLWLMMPVAAISGIGYGLGLAARKHSLTMAA